MKHHFPEEHKKDIMMKLVCGSVAGLLGQTFTYPLDVVRRQMQVQRYATASATELKGTINYLKVVPSVAIGFTVYDLMKSCLRVPSRDAIEAVTDKRDSQPSLRS